MARTACVQTHISPRAPWSCRRPSPAAYAPQRFLPAFPCGALSPLLLQQELFVGCAKPTILLEERTTLVFNVGEQYIGVVSLSN
jgi:hypothetical protein